MFEHADNFCIDLCSWINSCKARPEFNDSDSTWPVDRTEPLKAAVDDVTKYPAPNTRSVFHHGGSINCWNVSKVTSMNKLFYQKSNFNDKISGWDTSSVTTMKVCFIEATISIKLIILKQSMIEGATSFNIDICS